MSCLFANVMSFWKKCRFIHSQFFFFAFFTFGIFFFFAFIGFVATTGSCILSLNFFLARLRQLPLKPPLVAQDASACSSSALALDESIPSSPSFTVTNISFTSPRITSRSFVSLSSISFSPIIEVSVNSFVLSLRL